MTKLAIIGNSHVGAYVEARTAIEAAFPGLDLSFFVFPRHDLKSARHDETGLLAAVGEHNTALPTEIDLSAQDGILVVGQPFGMIGLNALLAAADVLGWADTGKSRNISPALFAAYLGNAVNLAARRLMKYFRDDGRFAYAPQPLVTDLAEAGSSKMASLAAHPEAARIFPLWHDALARVARELPCRIVPQPDHLRDSAVFTPRRLARTAALPREKTPGPADHIHMTPEYALEHFRAFAETWPELFDTTGRKSKKES
ncbi:hypothetical protein [Marimonas lutisalis]|uniref:hypothetical protein n=1 Tax=Marimonas lutisalis TaxID=2545756 RepID=UPI0010F50E7F|nr:hypothetical protein [Marimonas lutisalis]